MRKPKAAIASFTILALTVSIFPSSVTVSAEEYRNPFQSIQIDSRTHQVRKLTRDSVREKNQLSAAERKGMTADEIRDVLDSDIVFVKPPLVLPDPRGGKDGSQCKLPGTSQLDIATDGSYLYLVAWENHDKGQFIFKMDLKCKVIEKIKPAVSPVFGISYDGKSFWLSQSGGVDSSIITLVTSDFQTVLRTHVLPYGTVQGLGFDGDTVWAVHNTATDEVTATDVSTGEIRTM